MNAILGLGRRKCAVANVQIKLGSGLISINNISENDYFRKQPLLVLVLKSPLQKIQAENKYDIYIKVKGGGIVAQAYAIRLGIARALSNYSGISLSQSSRKTDGLRSKNPSENPSLVNAEENRSLFKQENFLTRDPRVKERRKYGRKKARKSPQFSKR